MKYKEVKNISSVFMCGNEIVITGTPVDEDEKHNCDEMGCSSVEHILLRGQFRFVQKGYSEDLQEVEI